MLSHENFKYIDQFYYHNFFLLTKKIIKYLNARYND